MKKDCLFKKVSGIMAQKIFSNAVHPHLIDIEIGKRLQDIRSINRMSQKDLAKLLNITFQQIQEYEDGQTRISASMILLIARHFGVSTRYFFEPFERGVIIPMFHSKQNMILLKHFNAIESKGMRRQLMRLVTTIATGQYQGDEV